MLLFKTHTTGRALFSAAVLWAAEAVRHHPMGRVFGFYFHIRCVWMLFSWRFFLFTWDLRVEELRKRRA